MKEDIKEEGHTKFRKFIENEYKGKSSYVCVNYGESNKIYCGCVIKGKIPIKFNMPTPDMECSENFFKIATMPMCGSGYFDQMKHCALASFFDDKEDNVPKDNKHKKMLIILDGCATCKDGGTISGLRITHLEEGAGVFSKCSEIKEYEAFSVSDLSINIPPHDKVDNKTASFTIPAILSHRICKKLFSEAEVNDKYVEVKLHIDYNCVGKGKATKVIDLPSIDVNDFKNRVAEMRGLWINLDGGNTKQFIRKNLEYSIEDGIAKGWTNPRLDCWTKNEICKENELE